MTGPRQVVVVADDFGASSAVNRAVLRAHCDGVVSAASLLVTGGAAAEAVAIARATPTLAVGLHLALADATPALAPGEIAHLVDPDGLLPRSPARAFLRLTVSAAARHEAAREIAAQFARFDATGLPLSHVDGHHHLHLHPAVFREVAALAAARGARNVRLPWEGLRALKGASPPGAAVEALVLGALALRWRGEARRRGLAFAARVHGILRSGHMDAPYVRGLLPGLPPGISEIFLHPSITAEAPRGPNPGDLRAVLDPELRAAFDGRTFALSTFPPRRVT